MTAGLHKTHGVQSSHRPHSAVLVLAGVLVLGACSAMPEMPHVDRITSVFGASAPEKAAPTTEAPPASAPQANIDYATSTDAHPDIWPVGQSGVARDPVIEAEVAKLLSQMTIEEKVGQIIQADIATATPEDVRQYHLGSILNSGDTAPNGNLRAPAAEWLRTADAYYEASVSAPSNHPAIPLIWGIDAMHGNDHIVGATLFPHNIGLGAMRDPDLVRKIGEITAQEMRVTGQDWTFAPTIAVVRDVRWGRTYESYSEDSRIVSDNATAIIEGLQGTPGTADFLKNGHVIATAKHYLGDGGADKGHDQGDALYSEPAMRDIFAPPYEAAIKAGAQTVMASYSSWRGHKMHGNKALLDDVLIGRLGFDGFVVSDYHGIAQVPGCSRTDCPASINAGVDMVMTAANWKGLYATILPEVKSGTIPMTRLDEAVARILRVKLRAGVLTEGKPSSRPYGGQYNLLGSPDHRAVARQAVRESLVLLKNDGGILPLSPRLHVLVAGEGADNMSKQTGGWTISWQGSGNSRADFPNGNTIYEGIAAEVAAAGGSAVLSADGSYSGKPDVAIVVFGENPYAEGRGDRPNVDFESGDRHALKLLQRFKAQGIPVVSVFLSGRPLYVTPEINASEAFVAAWLPGSEGAGVSDVLFAKPDGSVAYDFRGKLSFSWPRAPDQTPLNVGTEPYFPLFPFGYGLTYGAPRNLGPLPEAVSAEVAAVASDAIVESGHATSAWSLSLVDADGGKIDAGATPAMTPGGVLRVVRGDWQKQEDTLIASWNGRGNASLVAAGNQISYAQQISDGLSLKLVLRVDTVPVLPVTLAMGGAAGLGTVDLTRALQAANGRGWTTVSVPLMCFRKAGADMDAIATPMALTSIGKLEIGLSSVKVERDVSQTSCPLLQSRWAPVAKHSLVLRHMPAVRHAPVRHYAPVKKHKHMKAKARRSR